MALMQLKTRLVIDRDTAREPNLCHHFQKEDLDTLGGWVFQGYQRDKQSRAKWESRMEAAMDLAMQIQKDKNFPWPGCSNVTFPLVTIASLQFSSRSYGNIIQGTDVVKYRVIGNDPDQRLRERADRISKHMSWQVLEEDTGWEEQHDRLLINLGIVGCNFIKTYYSPAARCSVSELVMARDFVLDYWAKSVESCARKTQVLSLYRNAVYERVESQVFRDVLNSEWFNSVPAQPQTASNVEQANRQGLADPQPDEDAPYRFYEQHRNLDLDHDGYAEPYIVTIEESSQEVVKLTARWEREEDIDYSSRPGSKRKILRINSTEYYTKYGFIPAPDGGIYDVGFGTLLGPLNESVNSGINQLLDAGTMSNSNGGFLGRGVKIRGGVYTMAPWEWKRVDSSGDDLRKSMVPFPVREPSDVMFKLLGLLIEYTDRIAGTTDPMVGMNPGQNTPAETSRNTMEQGMKVYQGIFKRVWRSMKEEFKKRHKLNVIFLESKKRFGNADAFVTQEDYKSNPDLVVPAADPNLVSDSQRLNQAAMMREGAHQVPGYSIPDVEKNWLKALKVDGIEVFYPGVDKVPPLPNPKAQIEQMKMEAKGREIEYRKWEFVKTLQKDSAKLQADIIKTYAEIQKLLAETQSEKVKSRIEAFTAIVEGMETHQNIMTSQIEAMTKLGDQGGAGDKGSGVEGVAAKPGDAGPAGVPAQGAAGAPGPMGG